MICTNTYGRRRSKLFIDKLKDPMKALENQFQEQVDVFSKHLRVQSRRLSFEGVHALRISIRRLQSLISLLETKSTRKALKNPKLSLNKLENFSGDRRQWDVALRGARKYHFSEAALLKDVRLAGGRLHKILRSSEIQKIPIELNFFIKNHNAMEELVQWKIYQKMRSKLKDLLHQRNFSKRELHKLRISAKKIRYRFESLGLPTVKLKALQDQLGKCHDLTILSEYYNCPKQVKKDEKKECKKAQRLIRPALRSGLDVLDSLR